MHFVALVNVFNFETMGVLGNDSSTGSQRDLAGAEADTPIVVVRARSALRALSAVGLDDRGRREGHRDAHALLRRDGPERTHPSDHHARDGNIRFATADATAYPQPAPGTAAKPGPLDACRTDQLLHVIGYRTVELNGGDASLRNVTLG